jgi:hypothetical protein
VFLKKTESDPLCLAINFILYYIHFIVQGLNFHNFLLLKLPSIFKEGWVNHSELGVEHQLCWSVNCFSLVLATQTNSIVQKFPTKGMFPGTRTRGSSKRDEIFLSRVPNIRDSTLKKKIFVKVYTTDFSFLVGWGKNCHHYLSFFISPNNWTWDTNG